jgi:hypothetical protein
MSEVAVSEWVAVMTFVDESESGEMFYEAGGIYSHKPHCKWTEGGQLLTPDEHEAVCPRCGQRFAAAAGHSAEANRDLHFDGDEEIPSICR